MSIHKRTTSRGATSWQVKWRSADGAQRSRTFPTKRDAVTYDAELTRRKRLGTLATLDAGMESLDTYVVETWEPTFGAMLSAKTTRTYAQLYTAHVSPMLGSVPLRELTPELIAKAQSARIAAGGGPVAVRQAYVFLNGVLQRATEAQRIPMNPARLVRKVGLPHRVEVRPLAPATVEAIRAQLSPRDAMLVSLIAYGGLRPGEALGLKWGDVHDRTITVERAVSLGVVKGTKTGVGRSVRLLAPLAADLREWRLRSGRPADSALVIPSRNGGVWGEEAYRSWSRTAFKRALRAAGTPDCRVYDLRHSFASLLLHEGRSVIDVARQLGHGAQLTLGTYGHTIDELSGSPQLTAEAAIQAARKGACSLDVPATAEDLAASAG